MSRDQLVEDFFERSADLWRELAERGRGHHGERLAFFTPQVGRAYAGELMVIGRSTNGWAGLPESAISMAALMAPEANTGLDECQDNWSMPKGEYSYSRSAFWRTARDVLVGACGQAEVSWQQRLLWSNLYKLAPPRREMGVATTTWAQQVLQRELADKILNLEIETFGPKRILVMSGWSWAKDFTCSLEGVTELMEPELWIEAVGTNRAGSQIVVAKHPQGKPDPQSATKRIVSRLMDRRG